MHEKDLLKRIAIIQNTESDWTAYKCARNHVNKSVKYSKAHYCSYFFSIYSRDMRRTWKGINSILSKNNRSRIEPAKLDVNGATLQNPFDIAKAFNQHFVDIGPELASSIPSPTTNFRNYVKQTNSTFELTQLSQSEIIEIMNNLHINKASGLDTIPANLLKYSANYVSKSLSHIFNLSIDTGILPFD